MRGMKPLLLVTATALLVGCQATPPPPPVEVAVKPPPPKLMSVTSTSQDAVVAIRSGMDLADNVRMPEAIDQFNKALALDADCALAHALLGNLTPGTTGMTHLT